MNWSQKLSKKERKNKQQKEEEKQYKIDFNKYKKINRNSLLKNQIKQRKIYIDCYIDYTYLQRIHKQIMEEEKQTDNIQKLEESNFKVKFTRLSNYQDYQESYCEVCFQSNNKYFPDNDEKGIKMMVCYGCSLKCHAYCYGIDTQTQEELIKKKQDQKVLYFLCQKCRIEPKKPIGCVICNQKKGALKKIENSQTNEWVHITCGFYNKGIVKIDNYRTMSFVKQNDAPIEKDKKAKKVCHFCKSDVGIQKCVSEGCQQHAHVYCTMIYAREKELEGVESSEIDWFARMNYVNNSKFDISKGENETSNLSKNVYFQQSMKHSFNEISQILLGEPIYQLENAASFAQSAEAIPVEQKQSKISSAKKKTKRKLSEDETQDQNQENTNQIEEMQQATEITKQNKTKYQSKLVELGNLVMKNFVLNAATASSIQEEQAAPSTKMASSTLKKSAKNDKNQNSDNSKATNSLSFDPEIFLRGGELFIECNDHRRQDVYCVCQKVDTSDDMVYCDLCNDWYHYNCVKFTQKNDNQDSNYRCTMCEEWYNHKKKKLLKEFQSGKAESTNILIGNMPKFNLMDFISVVLITDQRIQNLLFTQKKGNIDTLINDAVNYLSYIPLFSSKIQEITVFKQRKYLHQAVNDFLQKIIEETQLLKIVSAVQIDEKSPVKYIVLEENLKKNEELKRLIDGISALFQRNKIKEKGILINLKKPIHWILKVHQAFFKKQEKISPLILYELMKDEEEDVKNTVEYQLLDQFAQRLKSWNVKVLSFYENIIQKANAKMEEEKQSVENTEKKQVEEDEFLNLKYKLWRDRLSTRPTIEELEQILEEGREIPVDCSQEIKKLEFEKDEVQIWFQTLDEKERSANLLLTQKLKQEERINKSNHVAAQSDQDGESKIKKENKVQSTSKASLQEEQAQEQVNGQKEEKIQVEEEQSQQQKQENNEEPKMIEEKNEIQNETVAAKDQMDSEENEQKGEQKQQEKMNEESSPVKDQQENAMEIEKNSDKVEKKGEQQKENNNKQEQETQAEGGKGHLDSEIHQKIYKNQQLMSKGDFEIFANQMFTKVVLQVPRMTQIIDMLQQYEVNELQWERLLEFINEKEQENNVKKHQQQELEQNQQSDEFIQQQIILSQYLNNTSKYELIEFQELKDLLDSCLKIEIKVPFLNQIALQMNNYLEQKAQFQNMLNSQFDESNYFEQLKKIQSLPFIFEEEKLFYERIVYFQEIQDICKSGFKKHYNVQQIQKLSEICQSSKFSEEINSEFQSKTESICQIAKGLTKILETGQIEKEQLDQAKELIEQINQIKNPKIDFKKELEILKRIEKSVLWFRTLHKFFFNINEEQIKLEESKRVQEIDLEIEEMLEAKNIDECQADIQEKWNLVCQNLNQVKGELQKLINEGISEEYHHDKRIKQIFQNLSEMLWINEAKLLLSMQDAKFEYAYNMVQSGLNIKINQDNEVFKKVKELFESTKKKQEEEMQLKQQQYQEMQKQQLEQEKLKLWQLQQQQQSLQSKNINLVVSDDSGNENGSYKSDWEEDEDNEDEDEEEEDEEEEEDDEEEEEEDNDDKDDSKTDKDGKDDNNDDNDGNGRNNTNQKGNLKKNDLIQIESDLSLMDEEESEQQQQQNESDTNNLNEGQKNNYKILLEQGLKWKNEVQSIYQIIQNCSGQDQDQNNNKMDIEKLSDDSLVTFQQLKNLLQEGYQITQDILKLHQSVAFMKSKMVKLENIFIQIHKNLGQFNKVNNPDLVDDSVKIKNCIDISDILIEYKVNLSSNSQEKLSFKNMIKFPFKNLNKFASTYKREEDLSYFVKETPAKESSQQKQTISSQQGSKQTKKQQLKQQEQQQKQKKQKGNIKQSQVIELESQENNVETNNNDSKSEKSGQQVTGLRQKSTRNKTKLIDSDYVYFTKHQTKEEAVVAASAAAATTENKQKQKAKQNNKQASENNNKKAVESQDENSEDEGEDEHDSANLEQKAKPEQVSDGDRSKTLESLKKTFMQNEVFSKSLNSIKAIENQLFGELNKDRKKYLIKAQQFANLFSKLSAYPQISKKLISKGLQMSSLEKLMNQQDQKLEVIEKQIKDQLSQQQESSAAAQNNPKSAQSSSNNKNAQSSNNSQNNNNQNSRNSSQQNVQASSQLQKNLNSAKEPQIQKKVKQLDSLLSIPGMASAINASSQSAQQSSSHNSNSALSMLIQRSDSNKNNSNANSGNNNNNNNSSNNNNNNNNNRQKEGNKYNSNSANNSQNSFQNKFKEDQQNKKNNQNYQQTNNRKRRNQQANFSDESENEEVQSKNDSQQEFSKDLYKGRNQSLSFDDDIKINKKSIFIDFENKKQEQKQQSPQSFSQSHQSTNEDKQTPKSSINKQDDENIEQIQNIFNSESKLYTFDKTSNSNQQSQGTELLYNPDEEEEGGQGAGVEMDIQKINQQYFDFDYNQNPAGTASEANQNSNSNNKVNNNQPNNSNMNYQNDGEKDNLYQKNSSNLKQKSDSYMNKEAYQNQMEEELDVPIPEDSIVRICSSLFRPQKNMPSIKIYMHTLEPIKKLNQFPLPQIIQNLDVKCVYTQFDEVNSYLSKNIKYKQQQLIIIRGWIEVQNPKEDSENFLQSIKQQDERNKIVGFKVGTVSFNLFTENQMKKTDFQFDIKPFNSDNAAVQYFVITKKTSEPKPAQPNSYEFVKFCTNLIPPISQQGVSPIISDNEDDENIMSKRDSIFDDKYNEGNQQDLKLDIIDFNQVNSYYSTLQYKFLKIFIQINFQIQQQIQELPTADIPQSNLDDKQPSYDHMSQPHGYQAHGHHQQQPYQGQYNSYQRQQPPPPPIPQMNQQGYPSNIPVPPPHSQMPFNHSNQSYQNTIPNYNMNSTPTHMQMGGPHQQQQLHHHLHSGNPINYNQQVPPQQIPPSPLVQNNMSLEQQENEKKDLPHELNDISNSQMNNEELFDFEMNDLDQIKMLLESDNAGTPSAQSSTLQSIQPPTIQIPPPQQLPIQPYHKMGSSQKQPPLPGQAPPFMHQNQPQGNLSESGSAQNQNPNIDPNLQQLIISQRSKPAYEMNPQIQPPFPNQAQQQQQPPQPQPNYQNKPYPPQQQQNLIPPPPHQMGNQNQMQPSHPQQYHGHQQQGPMQSQQWNQPNQQGNSQYNRNAPNQNKNQQYGMNNQNSNSYQKGMSNIPPPLHPGQMTNQQQNMNPQNYNNQNMGRQYSHNPQHNQNSNQSGGNNMNPRYNNNNNQGYGGAQYNNNNPNNQNQQQQNYNKFQRGNQNAMNNNNNNNNNGNTPNKGGHGYQQHKNPFGSRQQAHYQRNNQPYTAHNPVPFQDPNTMDNQLMQQQQMQYHPQQHDNMGDLDQRDYP
ncbi:hypothetical protein ABPG72_013876 [Tetrahymena utriculariae]